MNRKRGQNEGCIFEERRGRWVALLTTGYEIRDGKRRRIRKKLVSTTRGEVQERLAEELTKKNRGINVGPARVKLGEFLSGWLEHTVRPTVRPKTYRSYEQMVRNHFIKSMPAADIEKKKLDTVPGIGAVKLKRISIEGLERFFAAKLAAGNSPALVRYLRTVLRIGLGEALRRDLVERNIAAMVRPPQVPKPHVQPFTPDEARRFLAAVQGHRLEALFTVALAIGLRHGEALALQWEEIDLKEGALQVFHTLQRIDGQLTRVEPKSEESRRVVPLPPICVDVLKRHRRNQALECAAAGDAWKETGYVFTSTIGTPLIDRNVLRDFYKLLKQAKLARRRFHDLRHACVTLLAAQGVPDKTIAEIVGHSDVRLTQNVYTHASQEQRRAGLEKLGNMLSGLVAPSVAPLEQQSERDMRPN